MSQNLSSAKLKSNPALAQEWQQAEAASTQDPQNLRMSMRNLQSCSWKTSAITSEGSLLEWLAAHEPRNDGVVLGAMDLSAGGILSVGLLCAK